MDCLQFARDVFHDDVTNIDLATWRPSRASNQADVLAQFAALAAYLRLLDVPVASPYGPAADEPL